MLERWRKSVPLACSASNRSAAVASSPCGMSAYYPPPPGSAPPGAPPPFAPPSFAPQQGGAPLGRPAFAQPSFAPQPPLGPPPPGA